MDETERNELSKSIERGIADTEQQISRLKDSIKPVSPDNAIGRLTRMEAIQENKILEANLRSAEARLAKLKSASRRLQEDPDFGVCLKCGEDIPLKRLMLVPESLHCVGCSD